MTKNRDTTATIVDAHTVADATQSAEYAGLHFSAGKFLSPASDETQLIRLSQQGDGEAFGRLYDRYVERIYRYVFFRVSDAYLAEDVTAQVFMKMWEKLPRYQIGHTPIGAWLYRIAHNAVIDHYRTKKMALSLEDVSSREIRHDDEVEEKMDLQVRSAELRKALETLTVDQREVLIMRFIEGWSVEEIAGELGKRRGAVRALQMRGLRELARFSGLQPESVTND